ncbi:MAG: DUF268 domain-containing protein [Lachnospiraceae bacterium]|nr:DUF268 domain-containing protein [Lachnospiraceae bacterium]
MNIAIVGAGDIFFKEEKFIKEEYNITTIADNGKSGKMVAGYQCVAVNELAGKEYDKVLICSKKYAQELKAQLNAIGITEHKIISITDIIDDLHRRHDMAKYNADREEYNRQYFERENSAFMLCPKYETPMLKDYRDSAGSMDLHYYSMDILVAKRIIEDCPEHHYDIGSRIEGFISHLITANIHTTVIDIRPLDVWNPGAGIVPLEFIQADATNLETIPDNSIKSLSSLHAVEHFGLGRYGDAIDTEACFKAMHAMQRVLAERGRLYFAVPVGKENRLYFNAHRVFEPNTVMEQFRSLELEKFFIIHNLEIFEYSKEDFKNDLYGCIIGDYDCGIFIFYKNKEILYKNEV